MLRRVFANVWPTSLHIHQWQNSSVWFQAEPVIPNTCLDMPTINDLPNELIWHIATDLISYSGPSCGDLAAFALTNRQFYSASNALLYQTAAKYVGPIFWAAQNGRADTLLRLLQTDTRAIREENWYTKGSVIPTTFRVARWAGRYQSLNTLSGVIQDRRRFIGGVSVTQT